MDRRFFLIPMMGAAALPLCSCSRVTAPSDLVLHDRRVSDLAGGQLVSYDTKSQKDVLHIAYVFPEGTGFK
jgi:hypothetical protein